MLNESSSQVIFPAFVPFILLLDFGKGMERPAPPEPPAASAKIRAALVYIILLVVNNTDIMCLGEEESSKGRGKTAQWQSWGN